MYNLVKVTKSRKSDFCCCDCVYPWASHWTINNPLNPTATFAAFKFRCLTIDGNADSRGTSAVFQTVTLFYVCLLIFLSKSSCFWWVNLYVLPSV
jgi:hypothetical protein